MIKIEAQLENDEIELDIKLDYNLYYAHVRIKNIRTNTFIENNDTDEIYKALKSFNFKDEEINKLMAIQIKPNRKLIYSDNLKIHNKPIQSLGDILTNSDDNIYLKTFLKPNNNQQQRFITPIDYKNSKRALLEVFIFLIALFIDYKNYITDLKFTYKHINNNDPKITFTLSSTDRLKNGQILVNTLQSIKPNIILNTISFTDCLDNNIFKNIDEKIFVDKTIPLKDILKTLNEPEYRLPYNYHLNNDLQIKQNKIIENILNQVKETNQYNITDKEKQLLLLPLDTLSKEPELKYYTRSSNNQNDQNEYDEESIKNDFYTNKPKKVGLNNILKLFNEIATQMLSDEINNQYN